MAIGVVAILAAAGLAAACGQGGGGGPPPSATCSKPGHSPSALQIPAPVPGKAIPAGGSLSVVDQVEIRNFTSADNGSIVHFPSVYVKFPLNGGGNLSIYFAPTNASITGAGWTNVSTKSVSFTASTAFATSEKATLSTVSLAVMILSTDPTATVEVRWGWTADRLGPTSSHFTTPSPTATTPNLPSIFQPAAWVSLDATSNTTAYAGSLFQIKLDGAVGNTTFKTSLEYPNGTEIRCSIQTNYGSPSCFVVSVPLLLGNWTALPAGNYLIHIHDANGSIVHTLSITVIAHSGWGGWWTPGWGWIGSGQLSCGCNSGGYGRGHGTGWNSGSGYNWGSGGTGNGTGNCTCPSGYSYTWGQSHQGWGNGGGGSSSGNCSCPPRHSGRQNGGGQGGWGNGGSSGNASGNCSNGGNGNGGGNHGSGNCSGSQQGGYGNGNSNGGQGGGNSGGWSGSDGQGSRDGTSGGYGQDANPAGSHSGVGSGFGGLGEFR